MYSLPSIPPPSAPHHQTREHIEPAPASPPHHRDRMKRPPTPLKATIRIREPSDLSACVSTMKRVYAKDRYPVQGTDEAEAFLDDSSQIRCAWVATVDDRIVGHVAVGNATSDDVAVALWRQNSRPDSLATLVRLFVDPEHRGEGIAAGLVDVAVRWSVEVGVRLVLFALVKDPAAVRLYERLGWVCFGTTLYRYGLDQAMEAVCFVSPPPPT